MRPEEEQIGDRLGSYQLERQLGEGTMGRVWRARHMQLGRTVAIKVLRPEHSENPEVINRFFDEARAVNRIDHPHIVEIIDFVEDRDPHRVYCVMEHLEGKNLSDAVLDAPLPVQAALTVMRQVCDALAAAHRRGVVHRDVKPDNIFLARRPGEPLFVKVLDFGVAKLGADLRRATVSRTAQGTLLGTPLFMAPEQIVGRDVDARTDVYAVGCLLYWLLSGRLPFESTHFGELSMQVMQDEPAALPARTPFGERVPQGLAALALACLSKRPEARPSSMEAVRDGLERPWKVCPRRPRRAHRLALAAAVVLAAAVAWSYARHPDPPAPQPVAGKKVPLDVDGTIDPFAR